MSAYPIHSALLAAALVLGGTAAQAQNAPRLVPNDVSPAASLGYSASPQGYVATRAVRSSRELTVMGMTGGIQPKDVEATGSLTGRPVGAYGRAR